MAVIQTKALTKNYGKSRGITDLDLTVNEGDYFGFIGPNGAGKSTTIRTLLGLISPTSGTAEIFGMNVVKDKNRILANVGYMTSEAMFYNNMTVKDTIAFSARMRKTDCSQEAKKLCERLSLDMNKRIEELSLGNRKKVAIVCAMQHKPELCILDEPTGGLDPLMQKEFFDILKERHNDGAAIFLSSHILSEIQHNCKNAAIIKEGRIIAQDSVENLSKSNAKRVTMHGISAVPEKLDVRSSEVSENSVSFLYSGNIRELLECASKLPLSDMTITEPGLDEIFMHYYEKDGESK